MFLRGTEKCNEGDQSIIGDTLFFQAQNTLLPVTTILPEKGGVSLN